MSNKITELYNSIIENNTPEEINKLRQLLSITKNADIDSKVCKIKILSNKEYDKYLMNSTCDGSITLASIDVWHDASDIPNKTYVSYNSDAFNISSLKSPFNNSNNCEYYKVNSNSSYTKTVDIYTNILQNNINNNSDNYCLYSKEQCLAVTVTNSGTNSNYKYVFPAKKITSQKNSTSKMVTESIYVSKSYWANNTIGMILNFNYISSFRPAFDYIDNNKSTNIHY